MNEEAKETDVEVSGNASIGKKPAVNRKSNEE